MNGLACFAWSPDSQQLALADADHLTITLWNPATGEFGITLTIPSQDQPGLNRLQDVVWSPDGQYLAAAIPEADMLPDGTISPGGSLTAAGLSGVYIWQVQSRALLLHHQAEIPPFNSSLLSWSPDGQRLAFANKTTVQVLDLALQRLVLTYTGHVLVPLSVAWSPNGKYLASGGVDQTVQVWEAATGALRFLYQGHNAAVYDIAWSPDGSYLASSSGDGTAQVWQPEL
jgi:WD40 repeat protein